MYKHIKCKRCRCIIFHTPECLNIINAHNDNNYQGDCTSITEGTLIFLDEPHLPEWIKAPIEDSLWARGKLNCPDCNGRVGAFDYISGIKCDCKSTVLPPVYFIKSKIDLVKKWFKFCGDADCPDWVLAAINHLSKLSSVKLKLLTNVVAKGIATPPIDMEKAEKLFSDSKLDATIDLKACIACINYILQSTVRHGCDHNAMNSELQQLGLPREHSTALKKVIDEQAQDIHAKLKSSSLKINNLEDFSLSIDEETSCAKMQLTINGKQKDVIVTPHTIDVILENLKSVRQTMVELNNAPYTLH